MTARYEKLQVLNKLLNKNMFCLTHGGWFGPVIGVIDEENVRMQRGNKIFNVNIYDLRDPEYF